MSRHLKHTVFSPAETRLIELLGRRTMTIAELTKAFYGTHAGEYLEPNNYIARVIRRITAKCEHFNMTWTFDGEGSGRHGKSIWRARRETDKCRKTRTS